MINETDPSDPATRQTPSPVPAPSDGGNASERDSQRVETGNRDRFDNPTASERPDAGQDEGCGADGCTTFGGCLVCVREAAFEEGRGSMADAVTAANAHRARADAAEAKRLMIRTALLESELRADRALLDAVRQAVYEGGQTDTSRCVEVRRLLPYTPGCERRTTTEHEEAGQ